MRTLGNILWHFPCFGFLAALNYFILGTILTLTVVGTPLGIGFIKIAKYLLWPFGKVVVREGDYGLKLSNSKPTQMSDAYKKFEFIFRILWFPFGAFASASILFFAVACACTIINFPIALLLIEVAKVTWNPVNIHIVDVDLVKVAKQKQIEKVLENAA